MAAPLLNYLLALWGSSAWPLWSFIPSELSWLLLGHPFLTIIQRWASRLAGGSPVIVEAAQRPKFESQLCFLGVAQPLSQPKFPITEGEEPR